ncbi:MAG: SPOR domain-containing protein [Rhizobiaceae bacterium]
MKFSPVDATPDDAESALEIDLESELLGDLDLTDANEAETDVAADVAADAVRHTNVFGIPGLDEPLEARRVEAANDAADAPVADEMLDEAFDEAFDLSMDDAVGEETVEAAGAAATAAQVPPELENQLNALLAGLGDDRPDVDEAAAGDDVIDEISDPEPVAVEVDAADVLDELAIDVAEDMVEPEPVEDPLATLAEIVDGIDKADEISVAAPEDDRAAAADPVPVEDSAPLVETADITDEAVTVADDLDIPDVTFEHDVPAIPDFDELDQEFANAFNKLSDFNNVDSQTAISATPEPDAVEEPPLDKTLDQIFAEMAEKAAPAAGAAASDAMDRADDLLADDPAFDDDLADDLDEPYGVPPVGGDLGAEQSQSGGGAGRGIAIAMIVAGIAVAGGIGAFALSFGGGDEPAAPAMVKADDGPLKVKPKDPGGKTVPNEDKAVYERVAGGNDVETPTQEKLISTEEEPLDVAGKPAGPRVVLPGPADEVAKAAETAAGTVKETIEQLPGVKSDDRILPEIEEVASAPADGSIAITPKRVKTLIVKPDGTLVPREEPVEAVTNELRTGMAGGETPAKAGTATGETAETAKAAGGEGETGREVSFLPPAGDEAVTVGEGTGAAKAAEEGVVVEGIPLPTPAPRAEYKAQMAAAADSTPAEPAAAKPEPAAPKPAEPAKAATETAAPEPKVAAAQPAAADTEWWVQISSQPSREAAQASYAELAGRYGSIIGGRGVNIYRADIEGKGTYYRVRIAGGSRNEAAQLCSRLKSAGAGCFIAR